MSRRPWGGIIAYVNVPTIDQRILTAVKWTMPVPVFIESPERTLAGAVNWIEMDGNALRALGWANIEHLPEKTYRVGIDLTNATVEGDEPEGALRMQGKISGLTIYNGISTPAWDTSIEIIR